MTTVLAPVAGEVVGLNAVPDPVFAQAIVGPGTAIEPAREPGVAVAPIGGTIAKLHPHAFVVADNGRAVLVHLGIDTVKRRGDGFELLVSEGDEVAAGQPVIRWNPAQIEADGQSPVVPVVALDAEGDVISTAVSGAVAAGDPLFRWA
ncbi:PTS sugar transporter subunit IIA [Allonocardiopsis opalescens]|uniref:PTS system N-acetylglucosamine-specific IIA component n=1 Tax=Allonocardiopsis opalescens TaxID=1144618 RepID=A0A2T0QC86_9ACTN|nr:PTS glucose transporter subunit IIA [Allonocardiopsis opalescens]PRY01529.1 PTS system N-acetylglucosamine-specific IIA component [Allonocardiopsis opalescens]